MVAGPLQRAGGPGVVPEAFPGGRALPAGFPALCPPAVQGALAAGGGGCRSAPGGAGAGREAFASGEKRDPSFPGLLPHHSCGGRARPLRKAERPSARTAAPSLSHPLPVSRWLCTTEVVARRSTRVPGGTVAGSLQGGRAHAHRPGKRGACGRKHLVRPEPGAGVCSAAAKAHLCHHDISTRRARREVCRTTSSNVRHLNRSKKLRPRVAKELP